MSKFKTLLKQIILQGDFLEFCFGLFLLAAGLCAIAFTITIIIVGLTK